MKQQLRGSFLTVAVFFSIFAWASVAQADLIIHGSPTVTQGNNGGITDVDGGSLYFTTLSIDTAPKNLNAQVLRFNDVVYSSTGDHNRNLLFNSDLTEVSLGVPYEIISGAGDRFRDWVNFVDLTLGCSVGFCANVTVIRDVIDQHTILNTLSVGNNQVWKYLVSENTPVSLPGTLALMIIGSLYFFYRFGRRNYAPINRSGDAMVT